jgi:DNA-directed RNA polymerase subunit RPC12/RpoP
MWPFKRKKNNQSEVSEGIRCPSCGSVSTQLHVHFGNQQPDYIKTWRGKRYLTYRCLSCQTDFSVVEPLEGIDISNHISSELIDDEEELKAAEEELRRDADQEGDHRFK